MRMLWTIFEALLVMALLCSAWGGCVHPGSLPLCVPVSVMVFPLLALLVGIVLLIDALCRRWKHVAMMAAALLLCTPMLRLTLPLNLVGRSHRHGNDTISVLTLNVRNFMQPEQFPPNATLQYLLHSGADVLVLQEIIHDGWGTPREVCDSSFSPRQLQLLDSIYPYRSHDNDDVGIYSRFPFTRVEVAKPLVGFDMVDYFAAMEHHYAVAYDLHLPQGKQLRLLAVHLKSWSFSRQQRTMLGGTVTDELDAMPGTQAYNLNTTQLMRRAYADRAAEAQAVRKAIDDSPENVIVCGDFNDVPGSYTYCTVRGDDLRDAWADVGRGYAHTYNQYHFLLRIDHMLYRGQLRPVDIQRPRATASDHYPIMTTFTWQ